MSLKIFGKIEFLLWGITFKVDICTIIYKGGKVNGKIKLVKLPKWL